MEDSRLDFSVESSPTSNKVSASKNSRESWSQLVKSNSMMMDLLSRDSNDSSSPINSSEEELAAGPNDPLTPLSSVSCESFRFVTERFPSRNPSQESPSQPLNFSKPLLIKTETYEPSTAINCSKELLAPNQKKTLPEKKHSSSVSDDARNLPAVDSETNKDNTLSINSSEVHVVPNRNESLPYLLHKALISDEIRSTGTLESEVNSDEASKSTYQPLVQDCSSTGGQTSSYGSPNSEKSSERMRDPIKPRIDRFPIYAFEAQSLLQWVLKETFQYNEEIDRWRSFILQFLDDSDDASSEECGSNLEENLVNYLAEMKISLHKHGPNVPREVTIGTYLLCAYEMLTSVIVTTLTLTVPLNKDFDGFIFTYVSLRCLFDTFSHYWENNNIEAIEDEASRTRLKIIKNMIQRLLLVTLTACRLFLIYIGENAVEGKKVIYEKYLSGDDKIYLGRNG